LPRSPAAKPTGCASPTVSPRTPMGEPVIRYVPQRDVTPECELKALASVYRLVLERHAEKMAGAASSRPTREGGVDEPLTEDPYSTSSVYE
jgi:hypothetical protein